MEKVTIHKMSNHPGLCCSKRSRRWWHVALTVRTHKTDRK